MMCVFNTKCSTEKYTVFTFAPIAIIKRCIHYSIIMMMYCSILLNISHISMHSSSGLAASRFFPCSEFLKLADSIILTVPGFYDGCFHCCSFGLYDLQHYELLKCHWSLQFYIIYNYKQPFNFVVTLSSSADSLCPGDGVVFTCVTDTGRLVWDIKHSTASFHSTAQLNTPIQLDNTVFNVTLLNITGNIYHSTATAVHVPANYNGVAVACSSGLTDVEEEIEREILMIGIGCN